MPIRGAPPPPPPVAKRTSSRSIPPPVPGTQPPVPQRRTRTDVVVGAPKLPATASIAATLLTGRPESPTVIDRALVSLTDASKARADRLARELEATASTDRVRAARFAYELGELSERLQNEERALAAYRRALELDPTHPPNRWALRRVLYRRALWPELERLIDIEVKQAGDDAERVDLLFERALVSGRRKGGDDQARTALVGAAQLAPHHQGVLFELERVIARSRDKPRLVDVWERLAEAIDHPELKIAHLLEVARACAGSDFRRAGRAFDAASSLAAGLDGVVGARVARERLRLADAYGVSADVTTALDGYVQALGAVVSEARSGERRTAAYSRMRELAALRRRQAQLVRAENPLAAWEALQDALSLSPDDPVLLGDLVELAAELGRYKELLVLVTTWRTAETETGRTRMLSAWSAEARLSPERRALSRVLLGALHVTAPGFILMTAAAECDSLAQTGQHAELAAAYLDTANAAAAGTWLGPGAPAQPDPLAAASLYIQAAEVLAYYVATPEATVQARAVLDRALEVVPGHPAAIEALIELDDVSDQPKQALARCHELAAASPTDRTLLERALRVAVTHNVTDAMLDLQRRIVALDPADTWAAWRLDATLAQHGRDDERAQVLAKIATHETDPARRLTALIGAARHHERSGDAQAALAMYRELLPLCAQDAVIRDAYSDLLRTHERWDELATERIDAARMQSDPQAQRRALREAAWVLEVRLDDSARAAEVYEEWLVRLPEDRTALEGVARCRAALRDPQREVAAREAIAQIDQTTEAQWLFARSLERAGRNVQAIDQYRALLARDETSVAVATAALALGELAGAGANIAMRVEAAGAFAKRTTDTQLGAALFEHTGWMNLVGVGEIERASEAFGAALAIQPERNGALLGAALAAGRRKDRMTQGNAFAMLASAMPTPSGVAALLLRAAATATAMGESDLAADRVEAALRAAPDDDGVLFAITETGPLRRDESTDPFAAVEHALLRAELFARRSKLAEDQAAQVGWELERADALELAGQDRDASRGLAKVLERDPQNRRAVTAIRRIARRVGDHAVWAQASYVLARLCGDRAVQQRLLRDAASVYDRPGAAFQPAYARAVYSRLVALDAAAPEAERLLDLLREAGDVPPLINALTDQLVRLSALSATSTAHEHRMVPLLLERATLLRGIGNVEQARADLDALIVHAPAHVEALRQRADLAADTGDTSSAIAMWQRYLSLETTGSRRIEVERLLADALDKIDDVVPPPPPVPPAPPSSSTSTLESTTDLRAYEDENASWEMEFTDPDAVAPASSIDANTPLPRRTDRRISHVIRRVGPTTTEQRAVVDPTLDADFDANTVVGEASDPFGGKTATADLSYLQEEELKLAQAAAKLEADSVAAAAPPPRRRATVFTAPRASPSAQIRAVERRTTDEQAVVEPPRTTGEQDAVSVKAATVGPTFLEGRAKSTTAGPTFLEGRAKSSTAGPTFAERPGRVSGQQSVVSAFEQKSMVTVADMPSNLRDFADQATHAAPQTLFPPVLTRLQDVVQIEPTLESGGLQIPERDASMEDSAAVVMSYDKLIPSSNAEAVEDTLHELERELASATEPGDALVLRLEAARLAESGGEVERARGHYDAALAVDSQSGQALRGLRRLARDRGDVAEAIRLLDVELAAAGPRERGPLLRHRVDLLLAAGEHEAARAAIDELVATAFDVATLLAHFELALVDDRHDLIAADLERLAAVTTGSLRGALQGARAVVAARDADNTVAGTWFSAAAESDPESPALRLEAIRDASARGQSNGGAAMLELAYRVEREDPIAAAALAVRSQAWSGAQSEREPLAAAAKLAAGAAPRDPLVGRIAAETALLTEGPGPASHAFARWVRCKSVPAERAFAAARAAELDPARLGRMWSQVLDLDPGDDYAASRLRAAHVAAGAEEQVLELDLLLAKTSHRDVPLLRAAGELVRERRNDEAIELLQSVRDYRPSWALTEALADVYAAAKRWPDRARVLDELVAEPGLIASDIARLRSAFASDRAARSTARSSDERKRLTLAALEAWNLVLGDDPRSIVAHAASMSFAGRLEDRAILVKVLARARSAERSPWGASSLSLRYARMLLASNPRLAQTVARDVAPGLDDPRTTVARLMSAVHRGELGDAVVALEERATFRESKAANEPSHEAAMLRLRAAHIALDGGEIARAKVLLARVDKALPGLVDDLLEIARHRAGVPPAPTVRPRAAPDGFARAVRDGDIAASRGDNAVALQHYQRALAQRPDDPMAAQPLLRLAFKLRAAQPIGAYARDQLRAAQERGDALGKADAYELLARVDEMRGELAAAHISLENAAQLDPTRLDLAHQMMCELAATGQHGKLYALRIAELDRLEGDPNPPTERDRVALLFDAATLAVHDKHSDEVIAKLHHGVLELDRRNRLALFHLEAIMRKAGPSEALAALEEHIASAFDDPPIRATFITRAGETLADAGNRLEAVQRFARAADLAPAYLTALEAWTDTALAGELWADLAEAATRRAQLSIAGGDPAATAALFHFAGVALMDKARSRDGAAAALRRALDAAPLNLDALLRLRILVEHTPGREDYAASVRRRLEVETDRGGQVELHRMLAEHCRGLGQRDEAVRHYRAMLAINPSDVRAHAAIADVSTEQSDWRTVVEAVTARIPLERDVQVLRTLHQRLGMLYAEHDVPAALAAFQQALVYRPDDEATLEQMTDLAIHAGQWDIAVGACDRLVTSERDPARLAAHLHRAAMIFHRGFADRERADRMLKLAVDSAPASTESLGMLVAFYRGAGDPAALRTQLNRIVELMRARIDADVTDGAAYRALSRAVVATGESGSGGSIHVARAAAEMAQLLGAAGDPELRLLAEEPPPDLARLIGPAAEDELFAGAAEPRLRELFRWLAEPIAKHLGADVGVHGVGRKERVRPPHPATSIAKVIATSLGFKDVELYASPRHPFAMAAEPTSPVSLILGEAIVAGGPQGVRFAAGAALKLAQLALAIPARLPPAELGPLSLALVRLANPELTGAGIDTDAAQIHLLKLRKLVPAPALVELKQLVSGMLAVNPQGLARDLKIAGLRAGLAASGSLVASLAVVAGAVGGSVQNVLSDPISRGLVSFALSEHRNPH